MSRSSPYFRSPFYGNHHPGRSAAYISPPPPAKPKVVSIPVTFVGSDDNNKKIKPTGPSPAAAAIRIQSAFRGFLVRKNAKVVRAIGAEVDEIEMRFRRDEKDMDSIVRDEKERLKINEMLMRLLLRLDSVRGVRDYRKRVIQRVIAIQEMLDSFAAAAAAAEDQTLDEVETLENSGDRETTEMVRDSEPDAVETVEETAELKEGSKPDVVVIDESKTLENADLDYKPAETPETAVDQISNGWEVVDDDQVMTENPECVKDAEEESVEIPESSAVDSKEEVVGNDGTVGMKDVMERMVAENEKLRGMVAELCERSAQQCRLMGGLAQRVEHLEKIMDRMERSKKKKRKDSS